MKICHAFWRWANCSNSLVHSCLRRLSLPSQIRLHIQSEFMFLCTCVMCYISSWVASLTGPACTTDHALKSTGGPDTALVCLFLFLSVRQQHGQLNRTCCKGRGQVAVSDHARNPTVHKYTNSQTHTLRVASLKLLCSFFFFHLLLKLGAEFFFLSYLFWLQNW